MGTRFRLSHLVVTLPLIAAIFPGTASGFDGRIDPAIFESSNRLSIREQVSRPHFLSTRADMDSLGNDSKSSEKFISLYYQDPMAEMELGERMNEAERSALARIMARQVLSSAIRNMVDDVNLLYTIKEYGRAVTSANMKVENGSMDFEGPSLERAGNRPEISTRETLRSSLILVNSADFGVSLRTMAGPVRSNVTYFLAGRDVLGASLEREIRDQTRLSLEYRISAQESRVLATLSLPFPF